MYNVFSVTFLNVFQQEEKITACTSGRSQIIVGDDRGNIHFIARSLEISSEKAYDRTVSHLFHLKKYSILVSIGVNLENLNLSVEK